MDMAIGRLIPDLNLILVESNWERPKQIIFIFRVISNTLPTEAPSGMTYGNTYKW